MRNKRLIIILITAAILLSIPFVVMQFTNELDWKIHDFIIMGILLFGTVFFCELVMRRVKNIKYRIIFCGAVLFTFFIIWAELAVGVFGTPFAGS
jgi:hypothetical protein